MGVRRPAMHSFFIHLGIGTWCWAVLAQWWLWCIFCAACCVFRRSSPAPLLPWRIVLSAGSASSPVKLGFYRPTSFADAEGGSLACLPTLRGRPSVCVAGFLLGWVALLSWLSWHILSRVCVLESKGWDSCVGSYGQGRRHVQQFLLATLVVYALFKYRVQCVFSLFLTNSLEKGDTLWLNEKHWKGMEFLLSHYSIAKMEKIGCLRELFM